MEITVLVIWSTIANGWDGKAPAADRRQRRAFR
jgi:hypothetical protein